MLRIHISADWIFGLGLMLAMASAWAWTASGQAGNTAGIAFSMAGCMAALALMVASGRRM